MQRLMVPVDGSADGEKAARFAADLARLSGAEVTVVHVYEGPSAAAAGFLSSSPGLVDDTQAKSLQATFERVRQAMAGVEVKDFLVEVGQPAECILAAAERLHIDQIIMGSRGLSPLKELLLGSVSERVVRGATCPVTIVR